jgi:dephospho-CoA kinase
MSKVIKIGLTGNEGSGLHDVGGQFGKIGISVFNADIELKWILNYDHSIITLVKRNFGSAHVISGFINPLAFDNDSKIDKLIDMIEFKLFESFNRFVSKNSDKCYVIFLSSLIFERKWSTKFDMTVMVVRSKEERLVDFWRNSKYDFSQVGTIFKNEISQSFKSKNSEYIIDNLTESYMKKSVVDCDKSIVDFYFRTKKERSDNTNNSQIIGNIYDN